MYSKDRIRDAKAIVDRLLGLFRSVMVYGSDDTISSCYAALREFESKRCEKEDLQTLDALFTTRVQVDELLRGDVDTPCALSLVEDLVSRGNMYLLAQRGENGSSDEVLVSLTDYMLDVLDLVGLEGLHTEFSARMRRRVCNSTQEAAETKWRYASLGRAGDFAPCVAQISHLSAKRSFA